MISTISYNNVSIWSDRKSLGSIQWTRQRVHKWQERPLRVENLNPGVTPISNNNIILVVNSNTCGSIELTITFTMRAKSKNQLSIGIENL